MPFPVNPPGGSSSRERRHTQGSWHENPEVDSEVDNGPKQWPMALFMTRVCSVFPTQPEIPPLFPDQYLDQLSEVQYFNSQLKHWLWDHWIDTSVIALVAAPCHCLCPGLSSGRESFEDRDYLSFMFMSLPLSMVPWHSGEETKIAWMLLNARHWTGHKDIFNLISHSNQAGEGFLEGEGCPLFTVVELRVWRAGIELSSNSFQSQRFSLSILLLSKLLW